MILPGSFTFTLIVAILGMLCWGSWANTFKARPHKWRFELYCFDFAFGTVLAALLLGLTLGDLGYDGFSVFDDLSLAGKRQDLFAFLAGASFALGNMFLIGGMSISGMAMAFPVGMGTAVITGTILQYVLAQGNAVFLFTGVAVVAAALVCAALAYKGYSEALFLEMVQQGKSKTTKKTLSNKPIILAVVGGIFIGAFYPLIELARAGENGLGPYSVILIASIGIVAGTVVFNLFFMNLPVQGDPVDVTQYMRAKARTHILGILGGFFWAAGAVMLTVAGRAEGKAVLNSGILFGMVQAGVIVAMLWGIYRWHEYQGADLKVKFLANLTLVLLVIGVALTGYSQIPGPR